MYLRLGYFLPMALLFSISCDPDCFDLDLEDLKECLEDLHPPKPTKPLCEIEKNEVSYGGALCGSKLVPCLLAEDTSLNSEGVSFSTPSIALDDRCQPHAMFAQSSSSSMNYANQENGIWSIEETGIVASESGLVILPQENIPLAVLRSGRQVSTWSRMPDWRRHSDFDGENFFSSPSSLVRGFDGMIFVAMQNAVDSELRMARWNNDAWDFLPDFDVENRRKTHVQLGVSPGGVPHAFWWTGLGAQLGWHLEWKTPNAPAEFVAPLGSNSLSTDNISVTVTQRDDQPLLGTPHVFFSLAGGSGSDNLAYGVREGENDWKVIRFADNGEDTGNEFTPPTGPGETTTQDYFLHYPLAIVSNRAGEIRLLWSQIRYDVPLVSECFGEEDIDCVWMETTQENKRTDSLWLGWPDGETMQAIKIDDSFGTQAHALVDPDGRIHMAVYDGNLGQSGNVRYLRISPTDR